MLESATPEQLQTYRQVCGDIDWLYLGQSDRFTSKQRSRRERGLRKNLIQRTIRDEEAPKKRRSTKPIQHKPPGFVRLEQDVLSILRPGGECLTRLEIGDRLKKEEVRFSLSKLRPVLNELHREGAIERDFQNPNRYWVREFRSGDRVVEFRGRPSQRIGTITGFARHPNRPNDPTLYPQVRLENGLTIVSSPDLLTHVRTP